MALETGSFIYDLVTTNPTSSDPKSQGDDHLRLLKSAAKNTFPGFAGVILGTGTEAQGGTVNDYTVTLSPAPSAYASGNIVVFKATHANTGAATLQINALGTKTLLAGDGSALTSGAIVSGSMCAAYYDGTQFLLLASPSSVDVQEFTGNGTWTKPAGARLVLVELLGAGGGGGSGARNPGANTRFGGTPGGGGAYVRRFFAAADVATCSVTIGAAGTGGAAVSVNGNGNAGNAGGNTTFGSYLTAYGGGPGSGGSSSAAAVSGGGGGGSASAGALGGTGGNPKGNSTTWGMGEGGATAAGTAAGYSAEFGGGAGGSIDSSGIAYAGGASMFGGPGGGAGGGVTSSETSRSPAAGGNVGPANYSTFGGGGAAGSNGSNGSAGTAGAWAAPWFAGTGGGGGGAGTNVIGGTGAAGGAGGYGAGGGGGGAGTSANSGKGGDGGGGRARITTFF